ncbi:hypothetical protein P7C71_g2897, partial [Lecanoromycetidae sp. Uapishka_2]
MDLPQLYTKPTAEALLSALSSLAIAPSSFKVYHGNDSEPQIVGDASLDDDDMLSDASSINEDRFPSYLTQIVSNPLAWIETDLTREKIWEAASKRLSERSGRTAMPSVSRIFTINIPASIVREDGLRQLKIELHEPSLTGDNLGHKTWVASYLLATQLPTLLPRHFPMITIQDSDDRPLILELGAGTGLVGLAASGLFSSLISLTDLDTIVPNLRYNIEKNKHLTADTKSDVYASKLDWEDAAKEAQERKRRAQGSLQEYRYIDDTDKYKYDIIFAADSLYAVEHVDWLIKTMSSFLRKRSRSRIFVCLPLRPGSKYPGRFRESLGFEGFEVIEEGRMIGYDDWKTESGEAEEVECWWSVWKWASSRWSK